MSLDRLLDGFPAEEGEAPVSSDKPLVPGCLCLLPVQVCGKGKEGKGPALSWAPGLKEGLSGLRQRQGEGGRADLSQSFLSPAAPASNEILWQVEMI